MDLKLDVSLALDKLEEDEKSIIEFLMMGFDDLEIMQALSMGWTEYQRVIISAYLKMGLFLQFYDVRSLDGKNEKKLISE